MSALKIKVFSWNYGSTSDEKEAKIYKFLSASDSPDMFVVGLQEVKKSESVGIGTRLKEFMQQLQYKGKIFEQRSNSFTLLMGIFINRDLVFNNRPEEQHMHIESSSSFLGRMAKTIYPTKGALGVRFQVVKNGKIYSLALMNVHLPFHSAALTEDTLNRVLQYNRWFDEYKIVFGDLNSRSLFNDECTTRAMQNPDDEPFICPDTVYAKKIPIDQVSILETQLNACQQESRDVRGCASLSRNLQKNDVLNSGSLIPRNNFEEKPLYDWPSYKISEDHYSLKKGTDGRYAGYADRIVYTGNLFGENYKLIPVEGNDHFPVSLTLYTK
jgi:hypothetical protein